MRLVVLLAFATRLPDRMRAMGACKGKGTSETELFRKLRVRSRPGT